MYNQWMKTVQGTKKNIILLHKKYDSTGKEHTRQDTRH